MYEERREVSAVFDYEIDVVTKIGHKETLQNPNTPLRANWSFNHQDFNQDVCVVCVCVL